MNGYLIVDQDLEVKIERFFQWHTYYQLVEGLPHREMNMEILNSALEKAEKYWGFVAPYLIEPTTTAIPIRGTYGFGVPEALPGITCAARVTYFSSFKNKEANYSSCSIIWYQNDFAFPIDAGIL